MNILRRFGYFSTTYTIQNFQFKSILTLVSFLWIYFEHSNNFVKKTPALYFYYYFSFVNTIFINIARIGRMLCSFSWFKFCCIYVGEFVLDIIYFSFLFFFQVYFQRVLSSKTAAGAECISYVAALGCFIMAVPPIAIGAIAKSTRKFFSFSIVLSSFSYPWL